MSLFSRFRTIFILGAMFIAPLLLIYAQKRVPQINPFFSGAANDLRMPMQSMLIDAAGSVADFFYLHRVLLHDEKENLRLRAQVDQNLMLKTFLRDAEIENAQLRAMLETAQRHDDSQPLVGRVIGRMGSPMSRSLEIDVGEKDGISRGDAVIHPQGAVGQVVTVGKYSSSVMLISDSASAIDVLVERSRVRGLLKGAANTRHYRLRVEDFDRLGDVQKGDVVLTSGIGAKFPAGVPVGRITQVKSSKDRLYIEADIKPFASIGKLEEVMVIASGMRKRPWTREEVARSLLGQNLARGERSGK